MSRWTAALVPLSRTLTAAVLTVATVAATPTKPGSPGAEDPARTAVCGAQAAARDDDPVDTDVLHLRDGRRLQAFVRLRDTWSADATWTLTAPADANRRGSAPAAGQARPASSPSSTTPPGPIVLRGQFTGRLDSFTLRTYAERPHDRSLPDDTQFDVVVAIDDAILFDGRVDTNAHEARLGCHDSRVAAYTTAFDGIVAAMLARGMPVDDATVHTISVVYGPAAGVLQAPRASVRTFLFYGDLTPSWVWANLDDPLTPTQRLH